MSTSSYLYSLYNEQRKLVISYTSDISDITSIQTQLLDRLDDEQSKVNSELEDLAEDLTSAVTDNSTFKSNSSVISDDKQKSSYSDPHLKLVSGGLQEALQSLKSKKTTAETKRDAYYSQYLAALQQELASAFGF